MEKFSPDFLEDCIDMFIEEMLISSDKALKEHEEFVWLYTEEFLDERVVMEV